MKFLNKLKTHQKIFLFAILINTGIAILDIWSMQSGIFGTTINYTNGNFGNSWWPLFFKFNLISIILVSLSYFWFDKKHDKSEAFALFLSSVSLWIVFGLADLFFFLFQGQSIPNSLVWLNGGIIGKLSSLIGFISVNNISLWVIVLIGLVINYFTIKFFVKKL